VHLHLRSLSTRASASFAAHSSAAQRAAADPTRYHRQCPSPSLFHALTRTQPPRPFTHALQPPTPPLHSLPLHKPHPLASSFSVAAPLSPSAPLFLSISTPHTAMATKGWPSIPPPMALCSHAPGTAPLATLHALLAYSALGLTTRPPNVTHYLLTLGAPLSCGRPPSEIPTPHPLPHSTQKSPHNAISSRSWAHGANLTTLGGTHFRVLGPLWTAPHSILILARVSTLHPTSTPTTPNSFTSANFIHLRRHAKLIHATGPALLPLGLFAPLWEHSLITAGSPIHNNC